MQIESKKIKAKTSACPHSDTYIGSIAVEYASISKDDINKSIQEIKDAIKAVIEKQKIIPEQYRFKVVFEGE